MGLLSITLIYGPIAFILYKVLLGIIKRRRRDAEAARRGCQPAPILASKDPFGLLRVREILKAEREQRHPVYVKESMDKVGKNIHTVRVQVLDNELLVTRDPENVKAMFSSQTSAFDIGAARAENFRPLLGDGIFTSQGETWRHSRALVRPQFSREQVSDLDLEERHVQALLQVLKPGEDHWTKKVDLQPLFYNFTLDTATEFLYGQSVNSQNPAARGNLPGPNQAEFGHHLDASKKWVQKRAALSKLYWLIPSGQFSHHCKEVHKYVDFFVQGVLSRPKYNKSAEAGSKKFILLNELAEHTQDPLELRNETLHILAAGRDTTGALLGWLFYFLARHPRVYAKLRDNVLREFGTDHATIPHDMSFTKLRSSQYLSYCINETFRVAAVVAMNERVASRDTTLPRGGGPDGTAPVFVPKGLHVLIAKYSMQHRADIWGDDVEEFKPERWEGRKTGWEFVPFGGGPRQCLGRKFPE